MKLTSTQAGFRMAIVMLLSSVILTLLVVPG